MISVIYWAMLSLSRMFGCSAHLDVTLIGLPMDKSALCSLKKILSFEIKRRQGI